MSGDNFIVMTRGCYWLLQVGAKDAAQYPKMHSPSTSTRKYVVNSAEADKLGARGRNSEGKKGLQPPRAVAMTDAQDLKDKAKTWSSRFHYQE